MNTRGIRIELENGEGPFISTNEAWKKTKWARSIGQRHDKYGFLSPAQDEGIDDEWLDQNTILNSDEMKESIWKCAYINFEDIIKYLNVGYIDALIRYKFRFLELELEKGSYQKSDCQIVYNEEGIIYTQDITHVFEEYVEENRSQIYL